MGLGVNLDEITQEIVSSENKKNRLTRAAWTY